MLIPCFVYASSEAGVCVSHSGDDDTITITAVNEWEISWTGYAFGIDIFEDGSTATVMFVDYMVDQIHSLDPTTGGSAGPGIDLDPANQFCTGIVWNNSTANPVWYTNDTYDPVLYCTDDEFTTWSTVADPSGNTGRGMDFDGTDYWIAMRPNGIIRFQPGGSSETLSTPEVPASSFMNGITTFPHEGDIGIALTSWEASSIYFYRWDGSALAFLGSAPCPADDLYGSSGLGYSSSRGSIFWGYKATGGGYKIVEFTFDIGTALDRTTWGSIKAGF